MSTTRIEVTASTDRPPRLTLVQGAVHVRRLRDAGPVLRLALVAGQALLLAGDDVTIEVAVSGPIVVEVVETSGTVAYGMRGGAASWNVAIELTDGAELTWDGQPFVVSEGADVLRRTEVVAGPGCVAVLRETLVLGRTGEVGGNLRTRTRVELAGVPLVVEDLDLGPAARAGRGTLDGQRCLDSVTWIGRRCPDGPGVLQLEGVGSIRRWIGDELHRRPTPLDADGCITHDAPLPCGSGASSAGSQRTQ